MSAEDLSAEDAGFSAGRVCAVEPDLRAGCVFFNFLLRVGEIRHMFLRYI
jgi:hypothetical protein